MLVWLSNL